MMHQTSTDAQEIQLTIEQAQAKIARGEALMKLEKNKAFKELILDGFLTERALELTKGTARASLNEMGAKVHMNALIGIASLNDYFQFIYREASQAHQALYAAQAEQRVAEVEGHE